MVSLGDSRPELPSIEGITLLEATEQTTGALQSLVLDHVMTADGTAIWIDSRGNAATTKLARVSPSLRTLDKIAVARGFTAYQHYSLIEDLPDVIDETTGLIVLPLIDWFYAEDDVRGSRGEEMLASALTIIQDVSQAEGIPVLVTREHTSGLGGLVPPVVDETLECHLSELGPRFSGNDFETMVYRRNGYVQTTFAFWRELLADRHPQPATTKSEVGVHGTN